MGGCIAGETPTYAGAVSPAENSQTNRQLHRLNRDVVKHKILLLLGTGESGKSTFFRQLKLVALKLSTSHFLVGTHLQGFNPSLTTQITVFCMEDNEKITTDELVNYRPYIFRQILREMSTLVQQSNFRGWTLDSAKNIVRHTFYSIRIPLMLQKVDHQKQY